MLTPAEGISYAVLYGGPKSKLKGLVSPFCSGKIYLYCDNVKKSTKITDFDVKNFHLSFRENLFKSWAASLACEIVMKTKCAGNAEECWYLLNGFLDGLELCTNDNTAADADSDASGKLGLIRFLWRYLGILGIRPDTKYCGVCNKGLLSDDTVFDISENAFLCNDCAKTARNAPFFISGSSLAYLNAIFDKSPKEVRAIKCTVRTVSELKQLGFYLIETAIGQKLKTLESGLGIL